MRLECVNAGFTFSGKNKQHYTVEKRIGKAAAELIEEGETVILDSGTTTMEIARNLSKLANLTVITNALNIAVQLAKHQNVDVIIPGGYLRKSSLSLFGSSREGCFKSFFCDKLFLSVDGIHPTYGLSTSNIEDAYLKRIMIEISRQVIMVCDSGKFHNRSFAFIAPVSEVDVVITDSGIQPEDQKKLENEGIKVIIV